MRYMLDSWVQLELQRETRSEHVVDWMESAIRHGMATSATAMALMFEGAMRLPSSGRRNAMTAWMRELDEVMGVKVLPFDRACAPICARLRARAASAGVRLPRGFAETAAIAEARGLVLAALPGPHAELWGGAYVDPWQGHGLEYDEDEEEDD